MKKGGGGLRAQLNSNPLAQAAVIGALAILVGFLLLTRLSGGSAEPAPTETTTPADATAPEAAATDAAAPDAAAPDATADGAAGIPDAAAPGAEPAGKFAAGPGLPEPVVKAYDAGQTPVLLVKRHGGIDDRELTVLAKRLRGKEGIALFVTNPKHVADYSRIVGGVDIDRVPALIVISPKSVNGGSDPVASISYGFRGYESVVQAVENAQYDGKELPYYP
jgi:hypothetical protein